jgi:hypothetical protein
MIRQARMAALTLASALAGFAPAAAQGVGSAPSSQTLVLPFGPVPAELHGVACEARPGDAHFSPHLKCSAKDPLKQPSISVAVADQPVPPTRAELMARERRAFEHRPIFNVVREGDFVPPGDPEAIGYRALYQTEMGNRYVWAAWSKGKLVRVLVIVFAPTDFPAMIADIEAKIFGMPRVSPAARKD